MAHAEHPTDVHPEHERPTPANIDDWSDEQLDRYNELKDQELTAEAAEAAASMSSDEQAALETLGQASVETTTVELADADVTVKRHLNADIEDRFDTISEADRLAEVREDIVIATAWLIDDAHYGSEAVWEAYAAEYGTGELFQRFLTVAAPAMDRLQELGEMAEFRPDE